LTIKVSPTPDFVKALGKLPPDRQDKVRTALRLLMENPRFHRLDFRPLSGKPEHFIIDSGRGDRVILRRLSGDAYAAVDVGTHDLYRRWNRRR
jgi:mRNA-degrading endonuclease RelE of RelBE toxin-antitoxin system